MKQTQAELQEEINMHMRAIDEQSELYALSFTQLMENLK